MGLVEHEEDPEEWRNVEDGWSQVFRVRSKLKRNGESLKVHDAPGMGMGPHYAPDMGMGTGLQVFFFWGGGGGGGGYGAHSTPDMGMVP